MQQRELTVGDVFRADIGFIVWPLTLPPTLGGIASDCVDPVSAAGAGAR